MAKKKKIDETEGIVEETIDSAGLSTIDKLIKKKYGAGLITDGCSIIDAPMQVIKVSPRIDTLLNGGIVSGTWMNVLGPAKRGKTSLVLRMAKVAQDAGYLVVYNNVEHRLKKMNLEGTYGLVYKDDPTKFRLVQSTPQQIITGPMFLNINEDILKMCEKVFVVFDSISSFIHPKLQDEGAGAATRGGMGKFTSDFCNNMAPIVRQKGHIVVNIQQEYNNVTGYGKNKLAGGGTKVTYQGDCILEAKGKTELKSGDKIIGQSVEWLCECSELATIPGTKVESIIRYGYGIDSEMELIEMAKEVDAIEVSGAWLQYGEFKAQGVDKFSQILRNNKDVYAEIYNKVIQAYSDLREES